METAKSPYRAVTRQIEVKVIPRFLPERSSPENGYYFWAYTITLTNLGGETYGQEACFAQAFAGFVQIARRTNPDQYVGSGWHSSRTKVIDNALIGLITDQQSTAQLRS
jgi:hypothetical protein